MRQPTRRRRAYNRWYLMVRRCTDPRAEDWPRYGGRGITICDEWLDFDTYYAYVGDAPSGRSLDRIDNDRGYEPGNVRWATPSEQAFNRRERTECGRGHPYDEQNTYPTRAGYRACRACKHLSYLATKREKQHV